MNKEQLVDTISKIKEQQISGNIGMCPRCGKNRMKENIYTNALSRYADVYICDACGTNEALLDYFGKPIPLKEWVALCHGGTANG